MDSDELCELALAGAAASASLRRLAEHRDGVGAVGDCFSEHSLGHLVAVADLALGGMTRGRPLTECLERILGHWIAAVEELDQRARCRIVADEHGSNEASLANYDFSVCIAPFL